MANELDRVKKAEVERFLDQAKAIPALAPAAGRLIFAMDATASREPSWDHACRIQGEMFEATAALGGLDVQLVFYRGFNECKASRWLRRAEDLHHAMRAVSCVGGETQIARVLRHAKAEGKVNALVFVGDAMEEKIDTLSALAGELGLLGVPVFLFQEGDDPVAERAFRQIARLTNGAWCRFDAGSAADLRALLGAVASFAAGGRQALEDYGKRAGGKALALTHLMGQ
ncbi:MAG TPA: VWA domain-containing protein [Stellaceae bacterium]|nr:VWA domain-containing protein [Stellaceae bacterium]